MTSYRDGYTRVHSAAIGCDHQAVASQALADLPNAAVEFHGTGDEGRVRASRFVGKATADIQTYKRLAAIHEAPAASMPSVAVPSTRSSPYPAEPGWVNECRAAYRDAQAATARFGASLRSATSQATGHTKVPPQDPQVVAMDPPTVAGTTATAA